MPKPILLCGAGLGAALVVVVACADTGSASDSSTTRHPAPTALSTSGASAAGPGPRSGRPASREGEISIWRQTTPPVTAVGDTASVMLGTRFSSSRAVDVTAVRYYRGRGNAGPHRGYLWRGDGTLVAQAAFTGESAAGWQVARLARPVRLAAGQTYVVGYLAPAGRYAFGSQVFASGKTVTNGPLTATAGLFNYAGKFPRSQYDGGAYYVDVLTKTVGSPSSSTTSSPTSTTTTSPSTSTSTGGCAPAQVWSNLAGCGWPGPGNTGVPAGQAFVRTVTGGLVVTADNTVIDGWKVSGGIQVRARNVVIRNSVVTLSAGGSSGSGVVKILAGGSATIERSTLDGQNATHACAWHEGAAMTLTAVDCRGVNDGVFMWAVQPGVDGTGDNFVIQDSWLHDFTTQAGNGHVDGIQTEGAKNGVIRHNTIDVQQGQTSAIALWNSRKSVDNVRVERNLVAGGGFAVYAEDYSPSESSPAGGYAVTNVTFTANVFSQHRFGCVGYWGVWYPRGAPSDQWRRSGNYVLETAQAIDNGNPTFEGRLCS